MLERCGEWIGSLVDWPAFVDDEGAPYRPTTLVWFETDTGLIVDSELMRPEQALARAAGLFHLATRQPRAGEPRMPRRLRVSDPALATALAGSIGDVEIRIGETPEIDGVVASMREYMRRRDTGDDAPRSGWYLRPGVDADDVASFFMAAASFYMAAPWEIIPPDEPILVACPLLGIEDGIAVPVGQMGQWFGLSIYDSYEDFELVLAADNDTPLHLRRLPERQIMVTFDSAHEIDPALRDEIAEHGWQVAGPNAFPRATLIASDLASRTLTNEELDGVAAILTAIAVTCRDQRAEVADAYDGAEPFLRRFEISTRTRTVDVKMMMSGDGTEGDDDDPLAWESFEGFPPEDILEAVEHYAGALVDALGVADSDAADVLAAIVVVAAHVYGRPLMHLLPSQVRHLITKVMPNELEIDPFEADLVFDLLVLVFEQATTLFDGPGPQNCLRVLSPAARKRFVAALSDKPTTRKPKKKAKKKAKKKTKKSSL